MLLRMPRWEEWVGWMELRAPGVLRPCKGTLNSSLGTGDHQSPCLQMAASQLQGQGSKWWFLRTSGLCVGMREHEKIPSPSRSPAQLSAVAGLPCTRAKHHEGGQGAADPQNHLPAPQLCLCSSR